MNYRNRWRLSSFIHYYLRIRYYKVARGNDGCCLCHAGTWSIHSCGRYDMRCSRLQRIPRYVSEAKHFLFGTVSAVNALETYLGSKGRSRALPNKVITDPSVLVESAKTYATCTGVCGVAVDKMWRVLIGFGAVPACIALYYRLTIPETPRYTFDVARDAEKAGDDVEAYMAGKSGGNPDVIAQAQSKANGDAIAVPKASFKDFLSYYSHWKNGKVLLGTAGSWFLLDM